MVTNNNLPENRVIVHIDVDYFAVQLYLRDKPHLRDRPCITIQKKTKDIWNPRIVSVNTMAKRKPFRITRRDRLYSALKKCPKVITFEEDSKYNKPWDRNNVIASDQILDVIKEFCPQSVIIERNSIDGFFLDITDICKTSLIQFNNRILRNSGVIVERETGSHQLFETNFMKYYSLTVGALFVYNLCQTILKETKFQTSAGISFNRLLAKIGCDYNKPNAITIIPSKGGIARIYKTLNINEIPKLKKSLGIRVMEKLRIRSGHQLRQYRRSKLKYNFGPNDGQKIWNIARGLDYEEVVERFAYRNVSSGKNYTKGMSLNCLENLEFEIMCLRDKLEYDRLRNNRFAQHIRIEFFLAQNKRHQKRHRISSSIPLESKYDYNFDEIFHKIKEESNVLLGKRTYYRSRLTANNFKPIVRIFICSLFAMRSRPKDEEPSDVVERHVPSIPITEQRYQEFMKKNGKRLYVNTKYDI